jgi:hypothetical protein
VEFRGFEENGETIAEDAIFWLIGSHFVRGALSLEEKPIPRTRLSEDDISRVWGVVREFLETQPFINNRTLRALSGINYDQAIQFFGVMVERGKLNREGKSSGVKYTLPK